MKNWTKEDWQEAWTGEIIADDGKQVITDKEISVKLASLNNQLGLVNEKNQLILKSGHPSPLSANRGHWFGNKHFSKCNDYLSERKLSLIKWC